MSWRNEKLQGFIDATFIALDRAAVDTRSRQSIKQLFALLEHPASVREEPGKRLPVCNRFLDQALAIDSEQPALHSLLSRFKAVEPSLRWNTRAIYDNTASDNFLLGHANVVIVGPQGLEDRPDVWLGASLLAPNVRYPDHRHLPEETYLVMSDGHFSQDDGDWFEPGVGGSFYNPPNIRHAMRSTDKPLFAFWALLPEASGTDVMNPYSRERA